MKEATRLQTHTSTSTSPLPMKRQYRCDLLLLLLTTIQLASALDFLFNGFDSSDDVSLYGEATLESRILRLTNDTTFSIGRSLYPSKIPTKEPNSARFLPFYTSFIFTMAPYAGKLPGHGLVFLFVPHVGVEGASSSQHLGMFNFTNNGNSSNHVFGVEFDVFKNEELGDMNNNHVGVDVNSLTSIQAHEAGYWLPDENSFQSLALNNGKNYQVWIDCADGTVNVTMGPVGAKRPNAPLLSVGLNLSQVFEDEMYVGFTASTGALVESHKILAWSFSNTNSSLSQSLITRGLPPFELRKTQFYETRGFIAGLIVGILSVVTIVESVALFLFLFPSHICCLGEKGLG